MRKALPGKPLAYYRNMASIAGAIAELKPEGDTFRAVASALNLWQDFLAWRLLARVQTGQTSADRKRITEMSTRIRARFQNAQHKLTAVTDPQLHAFLHKHLQRFDKHMSGNP